MKFTAGREASMSDKSVRQESNLMLACTSDSDMSDPVGYSYQYAITMPRSNSMLIAAIMRGVGTFSVSEQFCYELVPNSTFTGEGTFIADLAALEECSALFKGEGTFTASAFMYEIISAIFDAGSRPSASEIAWETWMLNLSLINDPNSAAYKLNNLGDPLAGLVEGTLTARDVMRILLAVAAGKTTITDLGGGSAIIEFKDNAGTINRVRAEMNGSERINITLNI